MNITGFPYTMHAGFNGIFKEFCSMNDYEIEYVIADGITSSVTVSAANTIAAWDMFESLELPDVVEAEIVDVKIN